MPVSFLARCLLLFGVSLAAAQAADFQASGTVTELDGVTPIESAQIHLMNFSGDAVQSAWTDYEGHYTLTTSATCLANCWLSITHAYHVSQEQPVPATPTSPVVVNFALALPGRISGVARSSAASGSVHVSDAYVVLLKSSGVPGVFEWAAGTNTQTAGEFRFDNLPPGTYRICISADTFFPWIAQCHDHFDRPALLADQAYTNIVLANGEFRTDILFELNPGGSIGGAVRNALNAALVPASVLIYDAQGAYLMQAQMVSYGSYHTSGLSPGTYFVKASSNFGPQLVFSRTAQLYSNLPCNTGCTVTDGTPVTVPGPTGVAGIDFALTPRAIVRGQVRDAVSLLPLSGIRVDAYATATPLSYAVAWALTDANGRFEFYVSSGWDLRLYVPGFNNYVGQLWPAVPCVSSCGYAGTPFRVDDNSLTDGFDFNLQTGGRIGGAVFDPLTGLPVTDTAEVTVFDALTGAQVWKQTATLAGANYLTPRLLPGTYFLKATPFWDHRPCEIYAGRPCPTAGQSLNDVVPTPVTVAGTADLQDINFHLPEASLFRAGFE